MLLVALFGLLPVGPNPLHAASATAGSLTAASAPACASYDATSLLAWWKGEDNLVATVGPNLTGASGFSAAEVGRGFNLDAASTLSVDGFPSVSAGASVEAWVRPVQTQTTQVVMGRWQFAGGDGASSFVLVLSPNGTLSWVTDETSTLRPVWLDAAAPQLFDGQFHHVAATWSATAIAVYVDGSQVATRPSQGGVLNAAASTPFRLGSSSGMGIPFRYTGVIDEPAVYNRALSATEIGAIVAAGATGKCLPFSSQQKVLSADSAAFDHFGWAVAMSGTTAVVGANTAARPANASGAAYVFVQSGSTWTQQAELLASDGASGDQFGVAVAISGDTVVVGAMGVASGGNASAGAAYVFTRTGTTWTQQAKLTASGAAAGDQLGASVSIDSDTVALGASGRSDAGAQAGAVYVFTRTGTTWSQQAKLSAADAAAGDYLGTSVAIQGDTLVGGAPYKTGPGANSGAAYVFVRGGTTWTQQQALLPGDDKAGQQFGFSVGVAQQTAVVGSNADNAPANASGSAYVFVRSSTTWTQQAKLAPSTTAAGDQLGWSVAVSGDMVLVGAPLDSYFGQSSGSVYVFTRIGSAWRQDARLLAADGAAGNGFGWSSAIDVNNAIVGASFAAEPAGSEAGGAYFFHR